MMLATRSLAQFSEAIVPGHAKPEMQLEAAERFLRSHPLPVSVFVSCLVVSLMGLARLWRSGETEHGASVARLVQRMFASELSLLQKLAVWLKAIACMVALADEDARRAIYRREGIELPSDIKPMAHPPVVQTANHAFRGVGEMADYVIVGSGPAGSSVALALAEQGHSVLLLEEGPNVPSQWAAADSIEILTQRMRAAGTQTTTGPERIPILQGRCVGGGSVINSAIMWRAPEDVFVHWHKMYGLAAALPLDRIERAYAAVEEAIHVETTHENVYGLNSSLMQLGADRLGIVAGPTRRYTKDCEGLGRCMEGCPKGRKLAMNITLIPKSVALGARVLSDCRVTNVRFEGTRAVGVDAILGGRKVSIGAGKGVVLAASAIGTPLLLRASGFKRPLVGQRFQGHPGASVAAVFPTAVRKGVFGATQGLDSIHFRQTHGFKLESLSLPDEILATRLPGVGRALSASLAQLPYTALWATQVRAEAKGQVRGFSAMPWVAYHFTPRDRQTLAAGMKTLCEMFLAAGATAVYPGILGLRESYQSMDDLRAFPDELYPSQVAMILSHLFGTTIMGPDASSAVCDPYGAVHGAQRLYVADPSLFPTNLGVNPQHTIMAIANHVAWGLLDDK